MRPFVAVEIDGALAPYGGPLLPGYDVHEVESAAWREWAAMVYPPQRGLRLALSPDAGRALADLPADLVLVSTYTAAELEPLLPALGWETVPPLVPLRHTGRTHYMRVDDPGLSPEARGDLRWRAEEVISWARTHDRPVAWVRGGDHHQEAVRRTCLSTVGPLLAYAVDPAAGVTAADLEKLRAWAEEMSALPVPDVVVPVRCRDCGTCGTTVIDGRREDRVHGRCGSCCECYCPALADDVFQVCGDLRSEQCPSCRCCLVCVGCYCGE
ncbi:hypothetical protein ACSCBZ_46835 [Streptomyces niveiscabiei]|uniref:hypothetical protein n=1 Tax=Streptomyces niveiscabiei TaxID=164115 RepID=UPI0006EB8D7C|nr:hypothetical protein [Streptomyces niveiscabiei]